MMKCTFSAMSLLLPLVFMSCAEQYESFYLDTHAGELRVQLQDLHPAKIDSAIFHFTESGPMPTYPFENDELVLNLHQLPMGQHLTEVQVFSHMLNGSTSQDLLLQRHDILNTYILLHTPSLGIAIPGPGDRQMGWTSKVEAYYNKQPEGLEVEVSPQSPSVKISVDADKTVQQLSLSMIATIAGRKAEPTFLSFEKVYSAAEFYQNSVTGQKMYDEQGFEPFYKKLKGKDLRKMTYKYKVQYTDGTTKAFEFSVRK